MSCPCWTQLATTNENRGSSRSEALPEAPAILTGKPRPTSPPGSTQSPWQSHPELLSSSTPVDGKGNIRWVYGWRGESRWTCGSASDSGDDGDGNCDSVGEGDIICDRDTLVVIGTVEVIVTCLVLFPVNFLFKCVFWGDKVWSDG